MVRFVSLITLALGVFACGSDPAGADAGGGMCQCPAATALKTSYDHTSSMLGASNVQDAVDELAARPVPEMPVGQRIEEVELMVDNTGTVDFLPVASCPDPAHDIALGASCSFINPQSSLEGFSLLNGPSAAGVQCQYKQPMGTTDKADIRIMCLHKAK